MPNNPTQRFSERVPYYHLYRPRYPAGLIDLLRDNLGLKPDWIIADIGSGTGISSELFLKNGNPVYAIEPNADMRAASERYYGHYANFHPLDGTAEVTGLADSSVDLVTCGQAFHWFNHAEAKAEFKRILRPEALVVLFWNTRKDTASPFLEAYNALVGEYDMDGSTKACIKGVDMDDGEALRAFFGANGLYEQRTLDNRQVFDFDGFKGRLLSTSYIPLPGHPRYDEMIAQARAVFDAHQVDGQVFMDYTTEVFWGRPE
jgi:SAM-dependent methyltransferase